MTSKVCTNSKINAQQLTNAEFGRTVSKLMLRLILGEMSTLVLDGQRVLPKRLLQMGFQFEYGELRKALEDFLRRG